MTGATEALKDSAYSDEEFERVMGARVPEWARSASLMTPSQLAAVPRATPDVVDLGGWMQTHSGRAYHHQNPGRDEIDIGDIAHALSNICRFGGHTARFYSVAEHSVLVSLEVERTHPEHAFAALMHDATEAYVVDIPRPLKHMLGKVYADLEDKAWGAICLKFGIDPMLPPCVKEADNTVLLTERDALLEVPPIEWTWARGLKPAEVTINCWTPRIARNVFIDRFRELSGRDRT